MKFLLDYGTCWPVVHEANAEWFVALHEGNILQIYQSDFKNYTKSEHPFSRANSSWCINDILQQHWGDKITTLCEKATLDLKVLLNRRQKSGM